jgi:hypothetical protein
LISIPFCFNPSHLKIPHLILQLPFIIWLYRMVSISPNTCNTHHFMLT